MTIHDLVEGKRITIEFDQRTIKSERPRARFYVKNPTPEELAMTAPCVHCRAEMHPVRLGKGSKHTAFLAVSCPTTGPDANPGCSRSQGAKLMYEHIVSEVQRRK